MSTPLVPGHLLVVDDNRVNRLWLSHVLQQIGHSVTTAENGFLALTLLKERDFDVVLLDVDMPVMDGFQLLECMLADYRLRDVPVVMTSASDEEDRVVKCIELGAQDYLVKPLNPVLLRTRVNACLDRKRLWDKQKQLFRTFVTPEVAEQLLRDGFALGGEYVTASVMFADIRGFTSLCETLPPTEIIGLLNSYYGEMLRAISRHHGTVLQMAGDGLLVVFGAPLLQTTHRELALAAAKEMLVQLGALNEERGQQGKQCIEIGIGIATGRLVAGFTGSEARAVYTCLGDTVNLASRIQDHTKIVHKTLLIDAYTRDAIADANAIEDLGGVLFKGKKQSVNIFAVCL